MRYSLMEFISCSFCGGELACLATSPKLKKQDKNHFFSIVGTSPESQKMTSIANILKKENFTRPMKIGKEMELEDGLLICEECGHWFPLRNFIPELLPDHLRDWLEDIRYFKSLESRLPQDLFNELFEKTQKFSSKVFSVDDPGINHKKSEISIETKVTDEDFFGPGFIAPFFFGNTEYTMHLLKRFGNVLPLLEPRSGDLVLDIGAGYAWTTEWLMKMGLEPIGVDICRTYLDIGLQRMKEGKRPHLVVGDIENLPLKDNVLNSIHSFDAFHHIPDREKAMGHFFRSLKGYGNIVLAEPGGDHEHAPVSKDVMDKYGILEKGMELVDVEAYCEGLNFLPPEQHFVMKSLRHELDSRLSLEYAKSHDYMDCNIFVVKKRLDEIQSYSDSTDRLNRIKRKVKSKLKQIF